MALCTTDLQGDAYVRAKDDGNNDDANSNVGLVPTQSSGSKLVRLNTSKDTAKVDSSSESLNSERVLNRDTNKNGTSKMRSTFATKLMDVLRNDTRADGGALTWLQSGKGFVIHQQTFEQGILPRYFQQCTFQSFMRRLYRWGFKQIEKNASGIYTFTSEVFHRDNDMYLKMKALPRNKSSTSENVTEQVKVLPKHNSPGEGILYLRSADDTRADQNHYNFITQDRAQDTSPSTASSSPSIPVNVEMETPVPSPSLLLQLASAQVDQTQLLNNLTNMLHGQMNPIETPSVNILGHNAARMNNSYIMEESFPSSEDGSSLSMSDDESSTLYSAANLQMLMASQAQFYYGGLKSSTRSFISTNTITADSATPSETSFSVGQETDGDSGPVPQSEKQQCLPESNKKKRARSPSM